MVQYIVDHVTCPVFSGFPYGHQGGGVSFHSIDFNRRVHITSDGLMTWQEPTGCTVIFK